MSHYTSESHKGLQYSFSRFLDLTRLLYSSTRTLCNSYEKEYGPDAAMSYWQKEYPDKFMLAVLRTTSEGRDVIRFQVFRRMSTWVNLSAWTYPTSRFPTTNTGNCSGLTGN